MKVLLVQDQQEVREKITFLVESELGATIAEAPTLARGLELLSDPAWTFDLVIYDTEKGSPDEISRFWEACKGISALLVVENPEEIEDPIRKRSNIVSLLGRGTLQQTLIPKVQELVAKGMVPAASGDGSEMVRIRTKLLLAVAPLKGDIYIRLSESKFVKLFREGDVFDLGDLEKYTVKKGVEYLHIKKAQCKEFAEKYKKDLEKILHAENLSINEVSKLGEQVYETVQELAGHLGFTKEIQEIAKTQVQVTMKAMGNNPKLKELLSQLHAQGGKYIPTHSTLLAYLACGIASQMKWGSETTFHKLNLAAFLHDIQLKNQELAEMNTLAEAEEAKKFTPEELKAYKTHPIEAAAAAKEFTEVPPDVDTIIVQHHERPDGTGFPRGLTHTYIAPLAAVFIVAHELTQYALKHPNDFDTQKFIELNGGRYKSSQFKKVLSVIEGLHLVKGLAADVPGSKKI